MDTLPPKKTASRTKSIQQEPQVKQQPSTGKYDVKILAPITIEYAPVILACETVAPDGNYYLQNVNDVVTRTKVRIEPCYLTVANGRLEVLIYNLQPGSHQQCRLSEGFLVAKLVKV